MSNDAEIAVPLGQLADARLGYPFRGAVKESPGGEAAVVQIKNADPERGVDWGAVVRTTLAGRKEPDWLQPGDILFAARGSRNLATLIEQVPGKAVCAPQFFLLRLKKENVIPAYLAWYINQAPAQRYLQQSAEGSLITSIRRAVLEALPVPVPSTERQQIIARLAQAARREKQLAEELIRNREQHLRLVASSLVAQV